ncbi:MAG: cobalamin biosynthesis protein [Lachnospiraceae bacterium]|nr:cobalamin biosynthesis protein [Lachnospiraceae bacterium]
MKEQISILSLTEQGFRLAKRMQASLSEDGGLWLDGWLKNVRQGTYELCLKENTDGAKTAVSCRQSVDEPCLNETGAAKPDGRVVLYTKDSRSGRQYPGSVSVSGSLRDWCVEIFPNSAAVIFICAAGIAVRSIAPFLRYKTEDPAVLAADECGKHIISLLSGHLGGGNDLTSRLAEKLNADPVITTASDVGGKLAIDQWAQKNGLFITDLCAAKRIASRIVNRETVPFYCEGPIRGEIPPELKLVQDRTGGSVVVSVRNAAENYSDEQTLYLVPRAVILGIGCKKGKPYSEIYDFVSELLKKNRISRKSICVLASVDLKAAEPALLQLADELDVPFVTFSAETLREVPGSFGASAFVSGVAGVDNVCERAAAAALTKEEQIKMAFKAEKEQKSAAALTEGECGKTDDPAADDMKRASALTAGEWGENDVPAQENLMRTAVPTVESRDGAHFLCRKTVGNGMTAALLENEWEVWFEEECGSGKPAGRRVSEGEGGVEENCGRRHDGGAAGEEPGGAL